MNSLSPGYIATDLIKGLLAKEGTDLDQSWVQDIPMGRMAHPSEFQGTAVWMASDASSYLTGSDVVCLFSFELIDAILMLINRWSMGAILHFDRELSVSCVMIVFSFSKRQVEHLILSSYWIPAIIQQTGDSQTCTSPLEHVLAQFHPHIPGHRLHLRLDRIFHSPAQVEELPHFGEVEEDIAAQ